MHVTTIEEKLRLHLADTNATWSDADTALYTDGATRMLVVHRGPLGAAPLVDIHLRRVPDAKIVVVHEGHVTDVARRTAERFGMQLLDASSLPEPAYAPDLAMPSEPAVLVDAAPQMPALRAPIEIAPVLDATSLSIEVPLVADAPFEAPAPTPDFPWPAPGLLAGLDVAAWTPDFPLPPLRFFARLERAEAAAPDFPVPELTFFRGLETPAVDAFPELPEAFFDGLDIALVQQALEGVVEELAGPMSEVSFENAATAFDAVEAATPAPEPIAGLLPAFATPVPGPATEAPAVVEAAGPVDIVEASAEALSFDAVVDVAAAIPEVEADAFALPATPDEVPALPWAIGVAPPPAVAALAVAAEEVDAMPWNARDHELTARESAPRDVQPHPTQLLPQDATWGLPWPRPVAPGGLSIADPALWNVRERMMGVRDALDQKGAPSFGASTPDGSPWLRRLQGGQSP